MSLVVRIAQAYLVAESGPGDVCTGFFGADKDVQDEVQHIVRYALNISDRGEIDDVISRADDVIARSGGLDNFLDEQATLREQKEASRIAARRAEQTSPLPPPEATPASPAEIEQSLASRALGGFFRRGRK